jgi:nitroimidazol reductase NimA-like FMN-containing flavoprotein (pyridoxamine 5'-phosphate oxidase superfamily)
MNPSTPRRRRLEELGVDECLRLLRTRFVGRIAYVVDGRPNIMPLNYAVVDGAIVMRTGYGDTLDTLADRPAVAFEVDDIDPDYHQGWSVVVHGKAEEVWHPNELARLRDVPLRPWAPGAREHYVRILSSQITGRRIV